MKKHLNKIIIFILLSISCLVIFNYSSNDMNKLESKIEDFDEKSTSGAIEIINPTFKSKGINSDLYEISAEKGIQIKNSLELYKVIGKFTDNDKLVFIKADKGFYKQNDQIIELLENVLIYDELGNKTSTLNAIIDIKNKKMILSDDVYAISDKSIIQSNSSLVDEKNNMITYTGNVRAKIESR